MARIKTVIALGFALVVFSCVEEIPADNKNFVKYFGQENGSFGSSLYEYPSGNLIIGGKVDVPAFDYENVGGSFVVGKVAEGTMALIESDKNGNQINFSPLPVAAHETVPEVILEDISGKSLVNEVIPTSDGGFIISAEWRGINATLIIDGQTFEFFDNPSVTAPFLIKVSKDRVIEFIHSFNGEIGWDGTYHAQAKIRLLPDGSIGVLLGVNVYDFNQAAFDLFEGYTFLKLNQQGETLFYRDFHEPESQVKLVRDYVIDDNDNFIGIGQYDNLIQLFVFNLNAPENESILPIDDSGVRPGTPNNNDFFIEAFSDGSYVATYPNPPSEVRYVFITSDLTIGSPLIFTRANEYPRALEVTANDHFLIYTENLSPDNFKEGFLYKFDKAGNRKFKLRFEGTPGDVIESQDGSYLVLSNPLFNGLIPKARLTKLSKDGKTY
jgi:hypothetical protein